VSTFDDEVYISIDVFLLTIAHSKNPQLSWGRRRWIGRFCKAISVYVNSWICCCYSG